MEPFSVLPQIVVVGVGATAVMDLWLLVLKRSGVPTMDFALLGRWVGHVSHGRIAHEAIRRARPIAGEVGLGWLTHYAVGIVFAALLVALQGGTWLKRLPCCRHWPGAWPPRRHRCSCCSRRWAWASPRLGPRHH